MLATPVTVHTTAVPICYPLERSATVSVEGHHGDPAPLAHAMQAHSVLAWVKAGAGIAVDMCAAAHTEGCFFYRPNAGANHAGVVLSRWHANSTNLVLYERLLPAPTDALLLLCWLLEQNAIVISHWHLIQGG